MQKTYRDIKKRRTKSTMVSFDGQETNKLNTCATFMQNSHDCRTRSNRFTCNYSEVILSMIKSDFGHFETCFNEIQMILENDKYVLCRCLKWTLMQFGKKSG